MAPSNCHKTQLGSVASQSSLLMLKQNQCSTADRILPWGARTGQGSVMQWLNA